MPIVVRRGSIRLAKIAKDNLTFWFGVGRVSPWADENNPPVEVDTTVVIEQIQGFKRVETVLFVKEDPNGQIVFRDRKFSPVSEENIYDQDARYLYFSAWLMFDQFPVVTFRQTGLFVDVVPLPGYEGRDVLLPQQVNFARMIAYVNHPPRRRVSWGKDLIEMVLEFTSVYTSL